MNADAIDRLRDVLDQTARIRQAERRINIKLAISWAVFFLTAILLWVTK